MCRKDILTARKMLATNRTLTDDQRAESWHVDARLWFVKLVSKDYAGELAHMERKIEVELVKAE